MEAGSHGGRGVFQHRLHPVSDLDVGVWILSPPATGDGRGQTEALLGERFHWATVAVPTFNPPPPDAEGVIACFSASSCFFLFLSTASGFLTPRYVVWGAKKKRIRHMIGHRRRTLAFLLKADEHAGR